MEEDRQTERKTDDSVTGFKWRKTDTERERQMTVSLALSGGRQTDREKDR